LGKCVYLMIVTSISLNLQLIGIDLMRKEKYLLNFFDVMKIVWVGVYQDFYVTLFVHIISSALNCYQTG